MIDLPCGVCPRQEQSGNGLNGSTPYDYHTPWGKEDRMTKCPTCGKKPCQCPVINRGSFAKYVTKQEEIKEGLDDVIDQMTETYMSHTERWTLRNLILRKLASQDVKIVTIEPGVYPIIEPLIEESNER